VSSLDSSSSINQWLGDSQAQDETLPSLATGMCDCLFFGGGGIVDNQAWCSQLPAGMNNCCEANIGEKDQSVVLCNYYNNTISGCN
jgi:hypothetical protein